MKKAILFLFIFYAHYANAQTLPNFDAIKFEKSSDYKKSEPFVLQTATYLLSSPIKRDDKDRMNSLQFIGKWMFGTPDYSFVIKDDAEKLGKDNNDILGVYMAGLAKYTLENKDSAKDVKRVKQNALIMTLNYCENPNNNLKMSKQLKKLDEARKKGELEQNFP